MGKGIAEGACGGQCCFLLFAGLAMTSQRATGWQRRLFLSCATKQGGEEAQLPGRWWIIESSRLESGRWWLRIAGPGSCAVRVSLARRKVAVVVVINL